MGRRILVVGQGGREHALVWKLAQSPKVEKIYAAPGNPGIAELAECVNIEANDINNLLKFAVNENIDLTIVGPEAPLMQGIVDRFTAEGFRIFGPTASAARLEGSKVFAKDLFRKYSIPTAEYQSFNDPAKAHNYAKLCIEKGKAVVIKADGLAAGKGVIIVSDQNEAQKAINGMMKEQSFGKAGENVVIEEYLIGEEVSFFALTDGKDFVSLISAQDHKQIFDNDQGPNTGGMGAYANPPVFTAELHQQIITKIIKPVIKGMAAEGCEYKGVLYAGLMVTEDGPKVLEFNARFGDPETQVIMPMIKGDLLPLLEASIDGKLSDIQVDIDKGNCVCVVMASGGYPGSYEKGKMITGIEKLSADTLVFQAGTVIKNNNLYTNGGRVLALVTQAAEIEDALKAVYSEIKKVKFDNMHYRTDIGRKALNREV